jgi:hypothetical protein
VSSYRAVRRVKQCKCQEFFQVRGKSLFCGGGVLPLLYMAYDGQSKIKHLKKNLVKGLSSYQYCKFKYWLVAGKNDKARTLDYTHSSSKNLKAIFLIMGSNTRMGLSRWGLKALQKYTRHFFSQNLTIYVV